MPVSISDAGCSFTSLYIPSGTVQLPRTETTLSPSVDNDSWPASVIFLMLSLLKKFGHSVVCVSQFLIGQMNDDIGSLFLYQSLCSSVNRETLINIINLHHKLAGHGGSVVSPVPCIRKVAGSNPTLTVT